MISNSLLFPQSQLVWVMGELMVPTWQQIDYQMCCMCPSSSLDDYNASIQRYQMNESSIDLNVLSDYCNCKDKNIPLKENIQHEEVKLYSRKKKGLNRYSAFLLGKLGSLKVSLNKIYDSQRLLITRSSKLPYSSRTSSRRSRYIGVFKNGEKWQALISIQKKKTYIATFDSGLEAAKAFDLLSIILNKYLAKTNFDYCKQDIHDLLERFSFIIESLNESSNE